LKDEKVSIKKARKVLGEPEAASEENSPVDNGNDQSSHLETMLHLVLDRLDLMCRNNDNRDMLLLKLIKNQPSDQKHELLEQIARCREETRETIKLCQTVIQRGIKPN
jgi:DNA-binding transcriptional MerR regulator